MTLALALKLIHILAAIAMITGIIGRNLALALAARSTDIRTVVSLMPLTSIFEKRMVIPGSMVVLLAGIFTALAQGWPVLGFIQGSPINWVLVSLLLYLAILPLIIFILAPRGNTFEAALHNAVLQGTITPELTAAFHDPAVWLARNLEVLLVFLIVGLMVLKPF